jgi:hypothetical protein
MELEYTLEPKDLIALSLFQQSQLKSKVNGNVFWYYLLPALFFAILLATDADFGTLAGIFGGFLALYFVWIHWATKAELKSYYSAENCAGLTLKRKIKLSPEWMIVETDTSESRFGWIGIARISYTENHLFIYMNKFQSLIVPRASFQNENQFQDFKTELEKHIRANRVSTGTDKNPASA